MPVMAAAPFNWSKLLAAQPTVPVLLSEFAEAAAPGAQIAARGGLPAAAGRFAGISQQQRQNLIMEELNAVLNNLLGTGV